MIAHFRNNWYRFFGTAVVALCAIYTAWHQTHPTDTRVKTVTEKVIEGDGVLTEKQCREIEIGTERNDLRVRYGFPASEGNTDSWLYYPLRGKDDLYCNISLGYSTRWMHSGENRVVSVSLDLAKE
jgi:hypothetical protein